MPAHTHTQNVAIPGLEFARNRELFFETHWAATNLVVFFPGSHLVLFYYDESVAPTCTDLIWSQTH